MLISVCFFINSEFDRLLWGNTLAESTESGYWFDTVFLSCYYIAALTRISWMINIKSIYTFFWVICNNIFSTFDVLCCNSQSKFFNIIFFSYVDLNLINNLSLLILRIWFCNRNLSIVAIINYLIIIWSHRYKIRLAYKQIIF